MPAAVSEVEANEISAKPRPQLGLQEGTFAARGDGEKTATVKKATGLEGELQS